MSCYQICSISNAYITDVRAGQSGAGLFFHTASATATLRNVTVANAVGGFAGGGIFVQGSADMADVSVSNSVSTLVRAIAAPLRARRCGTLRQPLTRIPTALPDRRWDVYRLPGCPQTHSRRKLLCAGGLRGRDPGAMSRASRASALVALRVCGSPALHAAPDWMDGLRGIFLCAAPSRSPAPPPRFPRTF